MLYFVSYYSNSLNIISNTFIMRWNIKKVLLVSVTPASVTWAMLIQNAEVTIKRGDVVILSCLHM
jgi:hypothetical protein